MQATKPITTNNPARAGFFAVVAATVIIVIATLVASIAPSFGAAAESQAGANSAPLVLDPDARDGVGRNGIGPLRPQ